MRDGLARAAAEGMRLEGRPAEGRPAEGRPADGLREESRHDAGVVALADGFRAPFPRYWLSAFLADFGDGVRLAAFPLLAAQLTGSPAAVAAVTAVQGLPWLLIGAGLGVIVDRSDRRRLMLIVDITRAAVITVLAVASGFWSFRSGLPPAVQVLFGLG